MVSVAVLVLDVAKQARAPAYVSSQEKHKIRCMSSSRKLGAGAAMLMGVLIPTNC